MRTSRNAVLAACLAEYGLTRAELATLVNAAVAQRTGEPGEASERWVYYLLSGSIRWPRDVQRQALEDVFGVPALDLGFLPPSGARRPRRPTLGVVRAPRGGPAVDRRQFIVNAGSGAVVVALPDLSKHTRLGMSDVEAFREPLAKLSALDSRRGGTSLAPAAAAMVKQIEAALGRCHVSDKVRRAIYSLSGEYLASAGWFAIDADDLPAASRYLDHALRVSVIGRDPMVQAHIWNTMAWRADLAGDYSEALAIAQSAVVSTAARRSPRVAALWHGWIGQGHAWQGHRALAERSFARAHEALERTNASAPAPSWTAFLDHAELDSQAAYSHLVLGRYDAAATAARAALHATPPQYQRNRVSRQLMLAHAHLGQRDVEQAAAVATAALDQSGPLRSGRLLRRYRALHDQFSVWERDVPAAADWTRRFRAQVQAS